MDYVIFSKGGAQPDADGGSVLWSRSVGIGEQTYLRETVFPAMVPLSDDAYRTGPAKILNTLARSSYVLDGDAVYWCAEWGSGLVVVRFAPDSSLALAELRSPNPEFGGRVATDAELAAYDEDDEEGIHQYRLVFDAWDAQFEEDESNEWAIVGDDAATRFGAALAHVRTLHEKMVAAA